MKLIKAEETEFFYIFPEDDLVKEETTLINNLIMPESQNCFNRRMGGYASEQLIEALQNGTDTRLAIFKVNARLATIPRRIPLSDNYYKKIDMIKTIRCPNCNEFIGLFVLRFFDKVEDGN